MTNPQPITHAELAEIKAMLQLTQSTPLTMGAARVNIDREQLSRLLAEVDRLTKREMDHFTAHAEDANRLSALEAENARLRKAAVIPKPI